jgi:predicted enzyme related to lactoylglutathione lyase
MKELHPCETVVLADDFKAVVAWYRDVLGLEVKTLVEAGYHYAVLTNSHGVRLGIASGKDMNIQPGDRNQSTIVLQFRVEDVRALFEHVANNGGSINFGPDYSEQDDYWYGSFADCEGNPCWVVDLNCP